MNPLQLNELFESDKSDWFKTTEKGIKIWNLDKVSNFWSLIKIHKIEKGDYSFDGFIFPTFSISEDQKLDPVNNFYIKTFNSVKGIITQKVTFINCIFQGNTIFWGKLNGVDNDNRIETIFANDLIFSNCKFEQEFRLSSVKINGKIVISECEFFEEFTILLSHFNSSTSIGTNTFKGKFLYFSNFHSGKTNFGSNIYLSNSEFNQSVFHDNVSFNSCKFNQDVKFYSNNYKKIGEITGVDFNKNSSHIGEKYNSHRFSRITFSQTNHSFQDIYLDSSKKLTFQQVVFNNSVSFKKCDCNSIFFTGSDIADLNFSSCNWNTNYRLLMKDELEKKEDHKSLENLYRQLKKIFEGNKNWELSGKAYVSEMYIRKKRLWKEKNYLSWLIFSFYDFFGGFTQDYIKPLKWYFLFTFIFFPLYYLNFDCSNKTFIIGEFSFCNLEQAFQKSISSSLPFLKTDLSYENWWIKAIQTMLCSILLTFFILALRKRFKQ